MDKPLTLLQVWIILTLLILIAAAIFMDYPEYFQ